MKLKQPFDSPYLKQGKATIETLLDCKRYTIAIIRGDKDFEIGMHPHSNHEIYLVLSGTCICYVNDIKHELNRWHHSLCKPGQSHCIKNISDGKVSILSIKF